MTTITETEVVQACQTLFGSHINVSRDFLHYVQPNGVKAAYRKKAKAHHPDLFAAAPLPIQQKHTVLFHEILRAYDVLNLFFKQRDQGSWHPETPDPHPRSRTQEATPPKSASAQTSSSRGEETYFSGTVPFRTLQIGQYLYYRGKISFGAMINALVWQRKQRPSIGDIALRWGMLDADRIDTVCKVCDRPRLFGEKAVELGLLTVFQVNTILLYQRSQQNRLGNYFIQNNILSEEELERLDRELRDHNTNVMADHALTGSRRHVYA